VKRALITGIGGQDGSFLAELLLERGYGVTGLVRPGSGPYPNLEPFHERIELVEADLLDQGSLAAALSAARPAEVYNLASPSFVPASWERPVQTAEFAAVGATALLEAIRAVDPSIRFYQSSSSEIFGEPRESPSRRTASLRRTRTSSSIRTAGSTASMPAPESSTTTSRRGGRSSSCHARSRTVRRRSRSASSESSCSATSTLAATGAMRATTCARCG
jgi:nucleoside-diphosphate-sugar epimerase